MEDARIIIHQYWVRRLTISCILLFMIFFTCFIVINNFYKRKYFTKSNVDIVLGNEDFMPVKALKQTDQEKNYYFNSSKVGAYFFTKAYQKIDVKAINIISMEDGKIFLEKANMHFEAPLGDNRPPDQCNVRSLKLYYSPSSKDVHSPTEVQIQCKSGNYSYLGEVTGNLETTKFSGNKGIKLFKDNVVVEAENFNINYKKGIVVLQGKVKVQLVQ